MSAITQRPVQFVVTKSRRLSTDGNICTAVSGAGLRVHWRRWSGTSCEVLSTRRRWNPCSRTRYSAIECFPAQMPRKTSSTPAVMRIGRQGYNLRKDRSTSLTRIPPVSTFCSLHVRDVYVSQGHTPKYPTKSLKFGIRW
jgi:hypothetical protein